MGGSIQDPTWSKKLDPKLKEKFMSFKFLSLVISIKSFIPKNHGDTIKKAIKAGNKQIKKLL